MKVSAFWRSSALLLILAILVTVSGCKGSERTFGDFEYTDSIRLFSGSMGRSTVISDSDTVKDLTDAVNSLEVTGKGRADIDGYIFEISWLEGDAVKYSIILYSENEIGYDGYLYEADTSALIEVLSRVPMPL